MCQKGREMGQVRKGLKDISGIQFGGACMLGKGYGKGEWNYDYTVLSRKEHAQMYR